MTPARTVLLVLLMAACAGLGVAVVAVSAGAPALSGLPFEPVRPVAVAAPVTDGPVAVLRRWDRERAAAWAAGDVRRLRSLYVPGSAAADRDVARLRRWVERGERVLVETQLLRVRVLHERRTSLVLAVTDRTRAVTADGSALPADRPSHWRITLRRCAGEWRVAAVTR